MQVATLVRVLEDPQVAGERLRPWGLRDFEAGRQTLADLAEQGLSLDLLASLCGQLAEYLPKSADPDAAVAALHQYLRAVRSPLALAALFERDSEALPQLLAALSLGQRQRETLLADPEAFDFLRASGSQALERASLVDDVLQEVAAFTDERSIGEALRRFHDRHWLRVACGENASGWTVEVAMQQLTLVTEGLLEAALVAAQRKLAETRAAQIPKLKHGSRCVVLALGRLGGGEQDFLAALELLFVYDIGGEETEALPAIHEHYDRVARLMARLLAPALQHHSPPNLHFVILPDSPLASAAHTLDDAVIGFDSFGRTWHRQAMLRARAVAGQHSLATTLLQRLLPWLFRRYLSRADEAGIKALKRRILMEATLHQDDWQNVRLARGGLRDLETVVEFLQLLAGSDQLAARACGTLNALHGLSAAGVLSAIEHRQLTDSYLALRGLEHRLQVLRGTSELPTDDAASLLLLNNLRPAASHEEFVAAHQRRLEETWQTLQRLLAAAFAEEASVSREVELLLDPNPPAVEVAAALSPFGFTDTPAALAALQSLASEQVPFLSTRRCRHLLAAILPQLLTALAATPHPDRALDNLLRVSDSLGAKGVLWDLFRSSPPTLQLYVKLCAASPYLTDILTTRPGMLDELVDSLQLDRLPDHAELERTLRDLSRGAADILGVLHDLKDAQHLRIGVRDLLGKDNIDQTHRALTAVAETCLAHVARIEYAALVEKFGVPHLALGPREGAACSFVILALGRFGGRELNYHSPLDVLFLYEGEGVTKPRSRSRGSSGTANNHFFTQLAQRIGNRLGALTPQGRLYTIESLLRPIGVAGALALSLADFREHFAGGAAPPWQWRALCQARPVYGEQAACQAVSEMLPQLLAARPSPDADREEFRRSRLALEHGAVPHNVKRGPGGTLDVEFIAQYLQLAQAGKKPFLPATGTQPALASIPSDGILTPDVAQRLSDSYRFLLRIESGLRLLNTSARHDLPTAPAEMQQLAYLLGHGNPERLRSQCLAAMAQNRATFDELFPAPGS